MTVGMRADGFTEQNFIEREEYTALPSGTKLVRPAQSEVVIVTDGASRRLKALDEDLIDPPHVRNSPSKTDKRRHVVYFIDRAFREGSWGGNLPLGEGRRLFVRAAFTFRVVRGDRALALLTDRARMYSCRYFVQKLREKLGGELKRYVADAVGRGFPLSQRRLKELSDGAAEELGGIALCNYGVEISRLTVVLEEEREEAQA